MGCCPQTSVEGCTGSEQWSPSSSAAEVRHSSSIQVGGVGSFSTGWYVLSSDSIAFILFK